MSLVAAPAGRFGGTALLDGYRVLFSLAEVDPLFVENDVLVADTADGKPLSERDGKLRIVASKEKRGSRSVRMRHRLTVVRLRK